MARRAEPHPHQGSPTGFAEVGTKSSSTTGRRWGPVSGPDAHAANGGSAFTGMTLRGADDYIPCIELIELMPDVSIPDISDDDAGASLGCVFWA